MEKVLLFLFFTVFFRLQIFCSSDDVWPPKDVHLQDDPARWPGHMEPISSRFPSRKIYDHKDFPSGEIFFGEYVVPKTPLVMRNAFRSAVLVGTPDETLSAVPHAFTIFVDAKKVGDDSEKVQRMSMRNFIRRYKQDGLFLDVYIPTIMKSQFPLPRALECDEVTELLRGTRLEFRSGNWNVPLQTNSKNAIHCLLDGTGKLKMINYIDFKKSAEILDLENGTISGVDVEKVDFTRYPSLREVPLYFTSDVKPGDCFFVPSKWLYHLSITGTRTVQAAILWESKTVLPTAKSCSTSEPRTLGQATFTDETDEDVFALFTMNTLANFIGRYVNYEKSQNQTKEKFVKILHQDKNFVKNINWNDECTDIADELFSNVDTNGDEILSVDDVDALPQQELEHLGGTLEDRIADFKDILEDQEEEKPKGILDMAKTINQDYEKELHKILEEGFNEILRDSKIPGQLLFSNDGEPIIKMDTHKESIKDNTDNIKYDDADDKIEEVLAEDDDDDLVKLKEFQEKINESHETEKTSAQMPNKEEL